jgi:hypothetical protein
MYKSTFFLTSALVGEWSVSLSGRFTPGERAPGTHWIGGWVDLRDCMDDVEKGKFLTLPGLELRPSVVQPVASRYPTALSRLMLILKKSKTLQIFVMLCATSETPFRICHHVVTNVVSTTL